tara:strand:+ start:35 stop:2305 length:2271 start_codon:yes stop_codon:yes gene_type:complete
MKKLNKIYQNFNYILISLLIIFAIPKIVFANDNLFIIKGNNYTDSNVIISLLENIPENLDEEYSNEIIKILNESNLFSEVSVKFIDNKYNIIVNEYPSIRKIYFENNERLKDDELRIIANDLGLANLNNIYLNLFINETKKIYESYGYNNIEIEYYEKYNENNNTADLYFIINEGEITKINKIIINGNNTVLTEDIKEIIQSKTRSIVNIFANNNYKPIKIERDKFTIINYYKNNGFLDVNVETKIEYLETNKVNIYFIITEGDIYLLSSLEIIDEKNILNSKIIDLINNEIELFLLNQTFFSIKKIEEFEKEISSIIINSGLDYFEINLYEKKVNKSIEILFQVNSIKPKYTNQINIIGNSRTLDYVIRRELDIIEGDPIFKNQIPKIREKLTSLNLFESVIVKEEVNDDDTVDLIIQVEEKQTGTFNAGISLGTLDGFAIVTGLRENNFYGTGRSLDFLVNTSDDRNQFKLVTRDRLSYENDANINYSINFKQEDFSKSSSYKLDTLSSGIGIDYQLNNNFYHNIELEYVLKDYSITNSTSVSNSILNSSGTNISYLIKNNLRFSTLNPGFVSKKGNFLNFNNTIETPTSSNNGFIRNILSLKKYYNKKNSIFSMQAKLGNIFSLNNNDILTDDKFSLGGRWLRGFDNYGAGPRNSRTSYVGGNNLAATKFDYSYELTKNSNFPFYINFFNDYGLLWENKTTPTNSDNSLRSSVGFGFKYYSPIGPIGFTWGFPLIEKEYDIKRMFLFSVGNLD